MVYNYIQIRKGYVTMNIGETLKEARKERKLKLKDLSARTGITVSFLSDMENNKKQPSLETLQKIADALNLPVYSFFREGARIPPVQPGANPSYENFMEQAAALFMSSELTNDDKEAVFKDLTDLYWRCKGYKK